VKTYDSELRPIKVVVAILWLAAAATLVTTTYLIPGSEEINIQTAKRIKADSTAGPIELQPVSNRVATPRRPSP
jgi:hypothetical protein